MFISLFLASYLVLKIPVESASVGNEAEVESILQRMENSVLAFRDQIENIYTSRCDAETLIECTKSNYNDCSSIYPNQQCMDASEFVDPLCGDGKTCNGKLE